MNDGRIKEYVDGIFRNVAPSVKVTEQKEELVVNITERVQDYMREGLSFDAAFDAAKNIVGDTEELTAPFEKSSSADYNAQTPPPYAPAAAYEEPRRKKRVSVKFDWGLVALTPFIYVLIGFMQNWLFGFIPWWPFDLNWWAWGWLIIPISGILVAAPMDFKSKLVSLSPFIYLLMGFWFGWWAFGWIIIPLTGILQTGIIKVERK